MPGMLVVQPFLPQADTHRRVAACGVLRNHYVEVLRQPHYSAWRLTVLKATPPRSADRTSAVMRTPDTRRVLSREQAIQVYDRAGAAIKDSSSVYGGPATKALLEAADLASARSVFEYGSGSGGLAELLLSTMLQADCQYHAVDQSSVQVGLTQKQLAKHVVGKRAHAQTVIGDPSGAAYDLPDASVDAFVSTYVLDILSDDDIEAVLSLAHRLLRPDGQLCLVGLTYGDSAVSKVASGVWSLLHAAWPQIVGGCRQQDLVPYLDTKWNILSAQTVPGGVLRSQVIIACKVDNVA